MKLLPTLIIVLLLTTTASANIFDDIKSFLIKPTEAEKTIIVPASPTERWESLQQTITLANTDSNKLKLQSIMREYNYNNAIIIVSVSDLNKVFFLDYNNGATLSCMCEISHRIVLTELQVREAINIINKNTQPSLSIISKIELWNLLRN